jgi:ABC-type nitrate/sulfonate/bicarbonate transport system substrate-binding protein
MSARALLAVVAAIAFVAATPAPAAEKLRVGKPTPTAYAFALLEVGIQKALFGKYGLEIETVTAAGGARLHQAMTAGSLDIALGSGPDMGFLAKGAPSKAVAAMAGPLRNISINVRSDGSIGSPADLKGKKIGVTTPGSLTYWVAQEFSRRQGWGPDGVQIVSLGSPQGMNGALMSKNIEAMASSLEGGLQLESQGRGKVLVNFGDIVKVFITHAIFASDEMITKRPDALRGFLRGWFETIAYMREHRAETIRITREVTNLSQGVAERVYQIETEMFLTDGRFDREALRVVLQSLVDLGQLDKIPDASTLIDERFLP